MIGVAPPFEMPSDKLEALKRAKRLEWWSVFLLLSILLILGLTMGASQAMKAMWIEDTLSLIPSISFLVGAHFRSKPPDEEFPYGYRRAVLIGFLTASVALFGFGVYLLGDSVYKLIEGGHPTIQTFSLFGNRVWLGWPMLIAVAYSVIPPFVLGRMKLPLATELHDKTLHTSATLDKGDWLAGLAGMAGIVGIAFGYWWADAAAGAFISLEIVKDGFENLRNSIEQLMNKRPSDVENKNEDPVPHKVREALEKLSWVNCAKVRLREDGDLLTGEAFVEMQNETAVLDRLEQAREVIRSVDWRLYEVQVIIPIRSACDDASDTLKQKPI